MLTVLICDSLADNRPIIRDLLSRNAAWSIAESNSPQETADILAAQDVAVVLTDLNVADVNGRPFLETLRSQYPQIPAIVITTAGPNKAVVRALHLGAASYVPKTALARDLSVTVERLLALTDPRPAWNQVLPMWAGTQTRFAIPSDQSLVPHVVHHLQDELARYGLCGPEDRTRVGIALAEALANAIVHGNLALSSTLRETDSDQFERELTARQAASPYRDRMTQLTACFEVAGAKFVISDEGSGFDVRSVPDPTDEENLLKVTGRGLLLMRAFTDALSFNETGNEVTLKVSAKKQSHVSSP